MLQSGCMVPFALRLLLQINASPVGRSDFTPVSSAVGPYLTSPGSIVSPQRPIVLNRKPTPGANRIALAPNASNCRRR
jgi:hypothetical protein